MKTLKLTAAILALSSLNLAHAAGDPAVGATKAAACVACHGSKDFPGMFPLVQLGGRDADKLATKTNKYRTWKLVSPMMNMAVVLLNDKDVEDIAAYYQSLGKPAMPLPGIRGDEDIVAAAK
jgi:cytochrome c553